MNKSRFSLVPYFNRSSFFLAALFLAVGGCSSTEILTYSGSSQREGEQLFREGDYGNAAGAFKNAARQNPRSYQAHYQLGLCYQHMDQPQLAIAAFRTAFQTIDLTVEGQHDPATREKILFSLANTIAKNDPRNTEVDSLQRDAQAQKNAELWFVLAKVHELRGDPDSAIDAYNHAALLQPKNFLVAKNYGLYLVKIGQTQRAESPLRKAYNLNKEDQQVVAALRSIGVTPGPSVLDERNLAQPMIPKGPVPEMRSTRNDPPPAQPGSSSVAAPRD